MKRTLSLLLFLALTACASAQTKLSLSRQVYPGPGAVVGDLYYTSSAAGQGTISLFHPGGSAGFFHWTGSVWEVRLLKPTDFGSAGAGDNGKCISQATTTTFAMATCSGGGGTPGGSNTQVQYNNSGAFGGLSGVTSNGSGGLVFAANALQLAGFTSGTITVQPVNVVTGGIVAIPNAGGDTLVGKATTDVLTNKTLDTGGVGNIFRINGQQISSVTGNQSKVPTWAGSSTSGQCVQIDASGNLQQSGGACGGGGGSGTVNSGLINEMAYYASSGTAVSSAAKVYAGTGFISLGGVSGVGGQLLLNGSSSGQISILPQGAAGTYNFNLPTSAGTSGRPLLSAGGGSSPMTFGILSSGAGGTGIDNSACTGFNKYVAGASSCGSIAFGDLPGLSMPGSGITDNSGLQSHGFTGADTSGTQGFWFQQTTGAAPTMLAFTSGDNGKVVGISSGAPALVAASGGNAHENLSGETTRFSNSTTPQLVEIYNTTNSSTSPTNYERFSAGWISNVFYMGNTFGGTGADGRNLYLYSDGNIQFEAAHASDPSVVLKVLRSASVNYATPGNDNTGYLGYAGNRWAKVGTVQAEVDGANGEQWIHGQVTELLTLSTSTTFTDTSANLLPANSVIRSVVARITTTITTATDWKLGDATITGRFTAANSTMTSGTTAVGLVHIDQAGTSGPRQTAAAKVRVTTTGTPGAGAMRITVFYDQFVAPTS